MDFHTAVTSLVNLIQSPAHREAYQSAENPEDYANFIAAPYREALRNWDWSLIMEAVHESLDKKLT